MDLSLLFLFPQAAFWCSCAVLLMFWALYRAFAVPSSLRHLPCVPLLPLLWSYLSREPDDVRIKRLIMPFADDSSEGVVVVWAMGKWMVHVLDYKLFIQVSGNMVDFQKQRPAKDSMFCRFMGDSNIVWTNGETWKKQSQIVHQAFHLPLPIDLFAALAENLFQVIETAPTAALLVVDPHTHTVCWSDLTQRFALDAVGTSIIGHNFDSIRSKSEFVSDYNQMMRDIAQPLYLIAPLLERIAPRTKVIMRMDRLIRGFEELLEARRSDPGDDIMTAMITHPDLSPTQLRDNIASLFLAGHDTTAGAMSTLIYYLAVHPKIQDTARNEVISILGPTADPFVGMLSPQSMPYLNACIREALRINPPADYITPRISPVDVTLGNYYIPASTPLVCNTYAVHHSRETWGDPHVFRPERFLQKNGGEPWVPFSSGPRQCVAYNFALYELRTLTAMLLRRYDWVLPKDSIHARGLKNSFSPFALALPYDLDITFTVRQRSYSVTTLA
ncbi:cytochrome P450 [Hygrophoropsis aurantiaca]|uniref:Cytochrome P450 n=1 Tax=Hygrophoropsis aurantiaca TaxID=72124 RepID=A0ACB7ZXT7_9AGAM|nr:cytochrome P450 [Hygrophoropsis aurantiaca]